MKVIFLDNDGVICLSNNWGGRAKKFKKYRKLHPEATSYSQVDVFHRFDDFDKKAVKVLNEILETTQAEIVVSSDWKKYENLQELGDYYESQGIIKRPLAFTPSFIGCDKPEDFVWRFSERYEQERALEIHQYLKDHPEVTHWVAVDDLDMRYDIVYTDGVEDINPWGLKNFVYTALPSEGIKQHGKKEKILNFLQ
jgi:hypothetical protein